MKPADIESVNKTMFAKLGLSENGECRIVLGDTFPVKDELKAMGAKFDRSLMWHFDSEPEGLDMPVVKVSVRDFSDTEANGLYVIDRVRARSIVSKANDRLNAEMSVSEFVGEVGEYIDVFATLSRTSGYNTEWGWMFIYTFVDASGNEFVWSTQKSVEEGFCGAIRGKVKSHDVYCGVKQTRITYCQIESKEN